MTNMIVRVGAFLCLLTLLILIGRALPGRAATTSVACDVPTLISAINDASSGDTLDLAASCTYTLTSKIVNAGLPDIAITLTINGHGATITRDVSAAGFRLIYAGSGGDLTLNNLTLSNGIEASGAGIYADTSTVTVSNTTFSGNSATSSGGAMYSSSSTLTLNNDIVANSSSGGDCIAIATTVTANYNLIEDSTDNCGVSDGTDGNIVGQDPLLGTLTGSPAYFPLPVGSPAIDVGDNSLIPSGITTDQAGNARIYNVTVDMGAFEYTPAVIPTDTATSTPTDTATTTPTGTATSTPTALPTSTVQSVSAPVTVLCAAIDTLSDGTISASGGIQNVQLNGQTGNTYCHLIASGGSFVTSPAEIGVPSVLDLGVVEAVNIFGSLPDGSPGMIFSAPVMVCLRGTGDVLFLSASDLSRTPQHLAATSNGGFECVSVQNPGLVVMVGSPSNIPQQPADTSASMTTLANCRVTTLDAPLNLRAEPNTSAAVIAQLPYDLTLTAAASVPGWYRVIYLDG